MIQHNANSDQKQQACNQVARGYTDIDHGISCSLDDVIVITITA
jgi:hypothetical protein